MSIEAKKRGWVGLSDERLMEMPKQKPMTDEEIEDGWEKITGHSIFGGNRTEGRTMYLSPDEVIEFARAIEAAHGIKEKPND